MLLQHWQRVVWCELKNALLAQPSVMTKLLNLGPGLVGIEGVLWHIAEHFVDLLHLLCVAVSLRPTVRFVCPFDVLLALAAVLRRDKRSLLTIIGVGLCLCSLLVQMDHTSCNRVVGLPGHLAAFKLGVVSPAL